MAEITSQKTTRKTTKATTKTAAVTGADKPKSTTAPKQTIIPKDIDASQYVIVRNGFQGTLVYQSSRTGEIFIWDEFGGEQEMELRELRNAKNSHKAFFENNWFMFDDDWIIEYLGVGQFYRNALPLDSFDEIFVLGADSLRDKISKLSEGQKRSVAYRAKELIADKKIDSLSVIETLEDCLGIELIER